MDYSNNDNLLIQGYFTISLLTELHNKNFLDSDYYKAASFEDEYVHEHLPSIGIGNRGCLLISLYSLLVVPRQILKEKFGDDFDKLNETVEKIKSCAHSSYKKDCEKTDYIRHIRNAVAHARVEFDDEGESKDKRVIFIDENGKEQCKIEIPLTEIGKLMSGLQSIFMKYVEEVKKGFQS